MGQDETKKDIQQPEDEDLSALFDMIDEKSREMNSGLYHTQIKKSPKLVKDSGKPNKSNKHKAKKSLFKKLFQIIGLFCLSCLLLLVVGVGVIYIKYKPIIDQAQTVAFTKEGTLKDTVFKRAGSSVVLDKDGNTIAKVSGNSFVYDNISDISLYVQEGYIAVEDKDFLTEHGISIKGILRAGYEYIKNKGNATQGGSTITQQLIKNVFLTQEKTLSRKITELFLAPEIENRYSKTQILEYYINNCYYGEGCYGIESASQHFFSKSSSKLTLAESATLAGLSNNPTMWSPTKNPDKCVERRNIVLQKMLEQGYIKQDEYDSAIATKLVLTIKPDEKIEENYMSSYAVDCTVRSMMQQDGFQFKYVFDSDQDQKDYAAQYKEKYAEYDRNIRNGGYTIYTSLDTNLQAKLQSSVDNGLSDFTETDPSTGKYMMQGAAVSIDNKTGYVVAIVGGRGTADTFNRGFLAYRQPGSSIKPIIDYTPAFEQGYHPLSKVTDEYITNGPINDDHVYRGSVTLRYATELSINTIPYKLLETLKPKTGLSYLENLKYSGLRAEDNSPIIAIGGFTNGVTPVEQAGAYYALENKGYFIQPSCVTKVMYLDSEKVYSNERLGTQVYSADTSYMMTDIMKGVINEDYATGHGLTVGDQYVAGKTGTTSDCKDGWFCGYSVYYTTVVWCGYDTPRSVSNLYGATYPGHIWQNYMVTAHDGLNPKDFDAPSTIVYKNIDSSGNITSKDTGTQDMFSQTILQKQQDEEADAKKKAAAQKQADWDSHESDREQNADTLVSTYESMSYTSKNTIESVDSAYSNAFATLKGIDNDDVKSKLSLRLQAHHDAIASARQSLEDEIAKDAKTKRDEQTAQAKADAEAKANAQDAANAVIVAQQQKELQAEEDAKSAVKKLEDTVKAGTSQQIQSALKDAQDKTALVADSDIHTSLVNRIKLVQPQ